ncbi:MAG: hypothetical protein OEZ06_14205 [Myxococcales bacterium]|nr:hypothetical protein [Myxococcales bacterium]
MFQLRIHSLPFVFGLAAFVFLLAPACGDDGGGGSAGSGALDLNSPAMAQAANCSPGQTFTCDCDNGLRGMQFCQADGTLPACNCSAVVPSSEQPRLGCDPAVHQNLTCTCDDGRAGLRICGDDGVLGGCNCDLAADDGGADDDAG